MNTFSIPLGFSVQEHVYYIIVMIFNVLFAAPIFRCFSLWWPWTSYSRLIDYKNSTYAEFSGSVHFLDLI